MLVSVLVLALFLMCVFGVGVCIDDGVEHVGIDFGVLVWCW